MEFYLCEIYVLKFVKYILKLFFFSLSTNFHFKSSPLYCVWFLFRLQVGWDSIAKINYHIRDIVLFKVFKLRHDFFLKRCIGGLRKKCIFKLSLTSTPSDVGVYIGRTEIVLLITWEGGLASLWEGCLILVIWRGWRRWGSEELHFWVICDIERF